MPTPRKTTEKKLICKYCGTEFWRTRMVQRFCSQHCQQQYWIIHVKGVSANAGIERPMKPQEEGSHE